MYNYIRGTIDEVNPAYAVIDCQGVGYLLEITLNTYSEIKDLSANDSAEKIEEDVNKELRKGMPKDNERVETPEGLAKVVNVDYFNGKINTRAIDRDPETGEEVFSQEIHSFRKEEIRRIGKNAGKDRSEDIPLEVMFDSEADEEEIRELEELMREF